MRKTVCLILISFFLMTVIAYAESPTFVSPKNFVGEFFFGLRVPTGDTSKDMLSGFTLKFGMGYQITKNLEIAHLAFDFGNSSPKDPEWVTVYDPYSYYPRLEQEVVNVYGFPLTNRYRFQIKDQIDGYIGAGVAYYWFSTKLYDPYWGELKKSRKRHGPGGVLEAGVFTDAFSEKILVGLTANFLYLKTNGKTMTTPEVPEDPEEIVVDSKVKRSDMFLVFAISAKYFF